MIASITCTGLAQAVFGRLHAHLARLDLLLGREPRGAS